MNTIRNNIQEVQRRITAALQRSHRQPAEITLVAISKGHDVSAIREAFACGLRHFGESRVQEAEEKLGRLSDMRDKSTWHMVGHLQSNKAKKALTLFDMIQSVDSINLARAIDRSTFKRLPVLIEVNTAGEATRYGFLTEEVEGAAGLIGQLPNLELQGLMTIAPFIDDELKVRNTFRTLRKLRDSLGLKHLSMGMSDDFEIAIEEGSTIIRIGRAIFGERR
jgi:pyridoxal phosphate enzyme (YggS family)